MGSCPAYGSQYFENCLMTVMVFIISFFALFNICRISAVLTTTHQDRAKNQGRSLDCVTENFFDKAATFQWFEVGLCFDASLGTDCVIHYRFKLLSHAKSRCQKPSFTAVSSSKTAATTASAESCIYSIDTPCAIFLDRSSWVSSSSKYVLNVSRYHDREMRYVH